MNINKGQIKDNGLRLNCAKSEHNINLKNKNFSFRQQATKKVEREKTKRVLWLIFGGAIIGLINGFLGGGGGMICVPILQKVLALSDKESHASAIFVILPLSIVSSIVYFINGYVEPLPLLYVSIGVTLGGIIGAVLLKVLPSKVVRIIFALLMFIGGIKLIIWVLFCKFFYI